MSQCGFSFSRPLEMRFSSSLYWPRSSYVLARVRIHNRAVPPYTEEQLSQLRDAYRVLQVGFEASALTIKHAYRRKAQRWHPDKWPAESTEQRDAAEQMSQINRAYRLIRHAPLRYQLRPEPKIEAATHRRAETPAPVPRHAPLNDRDENAIRFGVGAAFGLFVALILSWHGLPGPFFYYIGAPLLCGWLAIRYGDDFWYYALQSIWWLWW
jgi:DnaJ domain